MSSTFETVAGIIAETCDIPREKITPDSHAINDLGIDSLDFLDVAFAIDKAFGIKMPLEQWTQEVNEGKVSTDEYFVLRQSLRQHRQAGGRQGRLSRHAPRILPDGGPDRGARSGGADRARRLPWCPSKPGVRGPLPRPSAAARRADDRDDGADRRLAGAGDAAVPAHAIPGPGEGGEAARLRRARPGAAGRGAAAA